MANKFISSKDLIGDFLKNIKPAEESWLEIIGENWEAVVGKNLAKNTKLDRFENMVLFVKVSNPIWRQELYSGLGKVILDKVKKETCPKLRRITWI